MWSKNCFVLICRTILWSHHAKNGELREMQLNQQTIRCHVLAWVQKIISKHLLSCNCDFRSRWFLGKMVCLSFLVVHIYLTLSSPLILSSCSIDSTISILQIASHFRIILELMVIRVIPLNAGHLVPAHKTSKMFHKGKWWCNSNL